MRKNNWILISSIIQLLIGIMAVLCFIIIGIKEDDVIKWIITIIMAFAFIVLGIIGIIDYKKNK